jgi:hypothetical protein
MKRVFSCGFFAVLVACGIARDACAATRVCSVYLESYSALQKQLALGAQAFQAPQLGALPMMISATLPGAAQMDNAKPVAMHVLDLGDGETATVVEVSPAGAPEAFLKALAGEGAELPAPVGGVYTLPKGTSAKVVGGRVFFALKGAKPDACLGPGLEKLSEMPALPGVIRVSVSPAALAPSIEKLKKTMSAMPAGGAPNAEQGVRSLRGVVDFYGAMIAQLDAYHLGINIQAEGLFIRSRLAPKAGTDLAALTASGKPAAPAQLAFIEAGSLFSYASGGCAMPERLKQQIVDLYAQMAAMSPMYESAQTNELASLMRQSVRLFGAPMAFTGALSGEGGALEAQGVMALPDPAGYLGEQIEMMKKPAYQKLMGHSGLRLGEPVTRDCKGLKAYSWKTAIDEQAMEQAARANLPKNLPPDQAEEALKSSLASMRAMLKLFGNGYEYTATAKELIFGMGSPAALDAAVERSRKAGAPSAEAVRIQELLNPSGAPHSVGRLSLGGLMGITLAAQPELAAAVKAAPQGEGILFASWPVGGEALTAVLVSASEIRSYMAFFQAVQAEAMQKQQGGKKPAQARPPIPANF